MTTTEMVNARSFIQIEKNLRHSPPRLWSIPNETRPVSVQIWDNIPETLAEVGDVLAHLWKVSVIDINFGCPSPSVSQKSTSGAYLLDYPEKIERIVHQTVLACAPTPVTIKMRLGTCPQRITACEVAAAAQQAGAAAITVHGRTASQGYSGFADWDEIAKVKSVLKSIPLIGNGDIKTPQQAVDRMKNYPVDGLMIGRGCLGKPWIFSQMAAALQNKPIPEDPSNIEKIELIRQHFALMEESLSGKDELTNNHCIDSNRSNDKQKLRLEASCQRDAVLNMRKIVCRYADGLPNACQFRNRIARIESPREFLEAVESFFTQSAVESESAVENGADIQKESGIQTDSNIQ